MTRTPAKTSAKSATKGTGKPATKSLGKAAAKGAVPPTTKPAAKTTISASTKTTAKPAATKTSTATRKVAARPSSNGAPAAKKSPATAGGFQQHYVSGARRALTRLENQLAKLEGRAGAAVEGRFAELFRQLESSQRLAEAKLARLTPGIADWDDVATGYEQATRAFRLLLNTARAELDAEPDVGGACVPATIRDQLEAWEAQVDELIVQAHLAGMDLRDEIAELNQQVLDVRKSVRRIALDEPAEQAKAQIRASFRTLASGWEKVRHQLART